MSKNGKNYFFIFAIILLLLSGYFNYKLFKVNRYYQQALPYFIPGERIDYLGLQSTDEKAPNPEKLDDSAIQILYIFSQPCSPCDKNIIYLKKFARLLDKSVIIRGIAIGTLSEGYDLAQKVDLGFNIFIPQDLDRFKKEFRLKFKSSQLIVCRGRTVLYVKTGEISSEEFPEILNMIRSLK